MSESQLGALLWWEVGPCGSGGGRGYATEGHSWSLSPRSVVHQAGICTLVRHGLPTQAEDTYVLCLSRKSFVAQQGPQDLNSGSHVYAGSLNCPASLNFWTLLTLFLI